jgi:hypothetical protein
MIDEELYRQGHRKEYEEEWMRKNRRAVLSQIETEGFQDVVFGESSDNIDGRSMTSMNLQSIDKEDFRQHRKDVMLAEKSPQQYCADRCVATGNCDVYEDMYDMTPQQVIAFCTECVLSEDEDAECDLPAAFFNNIDDDDNDDHDPERGNATGGSGSNSSSSSTLTP